ncbi:SAG1386/EF1546 family surface-associated protein [Enterococcus quebecensis]|uniref:LysM domain-containing protein n=1 Tax=Enterococcus quebecensis TaxID=903983 RepID=A0A1E5GQK0_9ENTE|nr:SAG1386/EF1546 family surface-associated protein [Enterococcus quebecensis]OEG14998.1 hypothetical protein BCR23_11500 [Enterococcus quebecensis]OJG74350.1 hypothetical protein RV12_GL002697 [Enterococcus quebecensis]
MSKQDKKKPSGAREPWEQSIYDTDKNSGGSRSEKRQQKKGNTVFLTILVILLLMIIALPVGTYLYVMRDKSDNKEATQPSSSVVVQSSTAQSSSSASSEASSSSAANSESSAPQETTPTSQPGQETPAYTEVLAGEGPNQVAARNGITTDELLQLNGLNLNSVLQPGQSLRVK